MVKNLLMILEEEFKTKVNKTFVVNSFMPTFTQKDIVIVSHPKFQAFTWIVQTITCLMICIW